MLDLTEKTENQNMKSVFIELIKKIKYALN